MILRFTHQITLCTIVLLLLFSLPKWSAAQQVIQLGSGTAVTFDEDPSPVNIYYRSLRYQVVYTKAELTAAGASAGLITALGFYIETAPSYDLPDYTISMKHTTATDASVHDPGSFTPAFYRPLHAPMAGDFDVLPLDMPFHWNGTDNIILDICFAKVPDYLSEGTVRTYSFADGVHYERDDDTDMCGELTFSTWDEKPQIVFEFLSTAANDAGIVAVDSFEAFCSGTYPIYATVQNFGINVISGVTVNWEFSGALQTPITVSTPIDTFGGTGSTALQVLLGSKTFASGMHYPIKVWTSSPNSVADTSNLNDTLEMILVPSLMGTYTIGGASPDFATFSDAAAALGAVGVCGSVTFKVRDGIYSEAVNIPFIGGASPLNTITFESESGDSSLVTLTNSALAFDENFTLQLDGADFVTFRKMTLEAVGSTYARVISLQNGASNNTFENNLIKSTTTTSASTNRALVYILGSMGNPNDGNLFQHNFFADGSYGFYWAGYFSNRGTSNTIQHNVFDNQYSDGGFFRYLNKFTFQNNRITTTTTGFYHGLRLDDCEDSLRILNNHISEANGIGMEIGDCNGTPTNRHIIANNFIHTKGVSSSGRGLNLESCSFIDVLHNTVNVTNTSTSATAFRQRFSGNNRLFNNIFANTGGGYFGVIVSSVLDSSDYNNWFTSGATNPGIVNTITVNNLTEWQTETGEDPNSLELNPFFTTPSNFEIQQNGLNNVGTPLATITIDITGEPRSPTTPDIGADEFVASPVDIGVTAFQTPTVPFTTGTYPIKAIVKNIGTTTITSFSVGWLQNNVTQTPIPWTGTLVNGDTVQVLLTSPSFTSDTVFNFTAWTLSPNGGTDAFLLNDTSTVNNLAAALSGVYTIGGTSPDFTTFTAAVDAMENGGVAGAVTFNMRDGLYAEQIIIPKILGASATNMITFQSESGDSSSSVGLNGLTNTFTQPATITLDGAEWIMFRQLPIQASGASYARCVDFRNGASHITLENNRFTGSAVTSTSSNYALIYGFNNPTKPNQYNTIQNNYLQNGSVGIQLNGDFSLNDTGTVILNNTLLNQYYMGLNIQNQYAPQIIGNTTTTNSAYTNHYSIYVYYSRGGASILRNKISGGHNAGLYITECDGELNKKLVIANNFIHTQGTSFNIGTGLWLDNSDFAQVYFNSIHTTHTNTSGRAIYYSNNTLTEVANNNIINTGGGLAIALGFGSNTFAQHDYNNLFATGTNLVSDNGTFYTDLTAWQGVLNSDSNSINIDPEFLSTTNLHTTNSGLNGKGTPITSITIDIDGETRQSPPDIGADEFALVGNDAAVKAITNPTMPFAAGNQPIEITLNNNGTNTLTSATVNFTVNGIVQPSFNWTGSLTTGQSANNVNIGSVEFVIDSSFTFQVWTSNPNGTADLNTLNDSVTVDSLYTGLSGIYTIGGVNPDFNDFQSTVNAMEKGGVLGAVTFDVRNGTYTEQLSFEPITGASAANTITYQSEVGDSSAVIIQRNNTSTNNYIIQLNGTDYMRFKKMTFKSLNASNMRIVTLQNGASYNQFESNRIEGQIINSTSSNSTLVHGSSVFTASTENNQFKNNHFIGGSRGIELHGFSTAIKADSTWITGNTFENQYYRPVHLSQQREALIDQNTITHTGSTYFNSIAILCANCDGGFRITKNKITSEHDDGIFISSSLGDTLNRGLVANNMIALSRTSADYGISLNGSDFVDVFHNTVRMVSTGTSSRCLDVQSNSNDNVILNNIFAHFGAGYSIYSNNTTTADNVFNYNDLYSTGTNLAYWGTAINNLSNWQTTSLQGANSVSVDPSFVSATDLHIDQSFLNNIGVSTASVTDDIDGDPRGASPDIGADEFAPITGNDAGVLLVLNPNKPFAAGSQSVEVIVRNYGSNPLTSATVQWSVDGALQPTFNWTGNLASSEQDTVTLGSFTFITGIPHLVESYTILPNNVVDTATYNDTTRQTLYPALIGTYTIGGTNPDFTFFADAVEALHQGGVIGAVTFNVRTGTYGEQLEIQEIAGASNNNRIVFQSESGDSTAVLLVNNSNNTNNFTIQLDGADYLTFRKMTFKASNPTYARILELQNKANYNRFENNVFEGATTTSTSGVRHLVNATGISNSHNAFHNNHFYNGAVAISLYNSSNQLADSTTIVGNIFVNQFSRGIDLQYHNDVLIDKNIITTNVTYTNYIGIILSRVYQGSSITNNKITGSNGYALYLNVVQASQTNPTIIANNFLQSNGATATMYNYFSSNIHIYHNNINQVATNTTSVGLRLSSGDSTVIRNNIIVANVGYAIYTNSLSNILASDYNDLYTSGSNIGYYSGSIATNLATWQAFSSKDANSISIDPLFTSATDLHVNELTLNNKGTPIPTITTDIDGETRNATTPDIGADEFTPPTANDAGIVAFTAPNRPFAAGSQPIKAVIRNFGTNTLTSATINWSVNNAPQTAYSWTGSLAGGTTDTITIGTFNFDVGQPYNLTAYTTLPNGNVDTLNFNDTTTVLDIYAALSGTYTIAGTLPDFTTFTLAADALQKGGVVGAVTFNVRNGIFTEQIELTEINGASATNTITFQSESGDSTTVTMRFDANFSKNYVVYLNEADYVTFKNITFEALDNTYARLIHIYNGMNNRIIGNVLKGITTTNTSTNRALIYLTGNTPNTTIEYNQLNDGAYGIYLSPSLSGLTGIEINNNTFTNQYQYATYLQSCSAAELIGNVVTTNSTYSNYIGFYLVSNTNDARIEKNKITGNFTGTGIYFNGFTGNALRGKLFNNFIQIGGTGKAYGIQLRNASLLNIYHNSVHISSTDATEGRALYSGTSSTSVEAINNIFANSGGGYAYYVETANNITLSDYNNLYATGTNIGYWLTAPVTNLAAWKTTSGKDANSLSINPLFISTTDLHTNQSLLDSAGTGLLAVNEDIDGEARNATKPDIGADEFNNLSVDVGVVAIITPVSGCDFGDTIKVQIQNFGNQPQSNFTVHYQINNGTPISETVTTSITGNTTLNYTFTTLGNFTNVGDYTLKTWTTLATDLNNINDSTTQVISKVGTPSAATNMLPANGTNGITQPIMFSWSPANNATEYDLYVWLSTDPQPTSATVTGITGISYNYNVPLNFGVNYNWTIVSKNAYCETLGGIQTFGTSNLPDLTIAMVNVPNSAFSEQTISVSWEVKNIGSGTTGTTQWTDAVYLSADNTLDIFADQYMKGLPNLSALSSTQSYLQATDITLPQGITGNYYIFIVTDRYSNVQEGNENNNDSSNTTAMLVNLTPPPDLQVTSIIATPTNVFSGSNLTVNYTVQNKGTGRTSAGFWRDRIYISADTAWSSSTATLLKTLNHTGVLEVDSFYAQTNSVTIPQSISGKHYIHVFTDYQDAVYEHAGNSNNISRNDSTIVLLTPPPDLVPTVMTNPDTVANLEAITVTWTGQNLGGSSPTTYWYDRVYISNSATFNVNTATILGSRYVNNTSLNPGATYNTSRTVTIPNNITGNYYFYIQLDATERIAEFTGETNNVLRSNAVLVGSPDLIVSNIVAPTMDTAGNIITLEWDIKNQGNGDLINKSRRDKLYMATAATLNVSTAIFLGEEQYSTTIQSDSTITKQKTVIIPNGISGNYYFYVVTDANLQIFELNENNNIGRTTNTAQIIIGPWADLQVTEFNTPDSTRSGITLPVDFKIMNAGQGDATNANWIDKLYLSPSPTWQGVSNSILLKQFTKNTTVQSDSMYRINTDIVLPPLPAGVSTNICYIYAYADADNNIFENTDEGNNILRSNPIFVEYPIPDLAITAINAPSAAASGTAITVNYTVTNIADTFQLSNYDYWYDGVYLSLDTIWDNNDIFITDYQQYENQHTGNTYSSSPTFTIPNGLSGNYYLLMVTDHTYLSGDNTINNNYDPQLINITLTPPADLEITAMTAPNTGVSGQPIKIYYTVRNNGTGATPVASWQDKIYLSTDFIIDNGDVGYTANTHTGILQPSAFYNDSITINTPVSFSGNYILLLKTDQANVVFELNKENNNTASAAISLAQPPPSDLVVESIMLPDTVIAGETATVSWTTKNNGANPAIGIMQEAVYFSSDAVLDVNDVLLGIRTSNVNIAPLATVNQSISAALPGLPLGQYYAIVVTDLRNNIFEANDTNNTSVSINLAQVVVRELPLNVLTPNTLNRNIPIYYRIDIPNTLAGETLLIEMNGDSVFGRNELYLSHNKVPTRSNFDLSHDNVIQGHQDLIVPSLQAGTYYLMIYGSDARSSVTMQTITTKARILDFEIRSVQVNKGGNTGTVTVKIEGAKFTDNMTFGLQDAALGTITGMQLVYVDPSTVFVTFDLNGAALGIYDVVASKPNGTSVALNNGFTVESSTGELLLTDIRHPSQTRFNRVVAITIEFTNGGNVDIPSPTRSIVSLRDAPLAFSTAGLANGIKDLFLEFFEINGPQHVLRPGASSSVTVYSRASTAQRLRFKLLK